MQKSLEDDGATLITCPAERPFATSDMESCEICPPSKPYRNLMTAECSECRKELNEKGEVTGCLAMDVSGSMPEPISVTPTANITNNYDSINSLPTPMPVTPVAPNFFYSS